MNEIDLGIPAVLEWLSVNPKKVDGFRDDKFFLKIRTDKGVPHDEIHFRNKHNNLVGKIINIDMS